MDLACQPLRDPALTRCPDSLTTTQPRAGRCGLPEQSPRRHRFLSASMFDYQRLCAVAP